MTEIVHTTDLSDGFFVTIIQIAERLGASPLDILRVCMAESGCRSSARNPTSSASGLIQFMADYWQKTWSFTRDEFTALSAEDQLPCVEEYFRPYKGRLVNVSAVYAAVFLPVVLPHAAEPGWVIAAPKGPFAWVYSANQGLDVGQKGHIAVNDLRLAVERHCTGPRWAEIVARLEAVTITNDGSFQTLPTS